MMVTALSRPATGTIDNYINNRKALMAFKEKIRMQVWRSIAAFGLLALSVATPALGDDNGPKQFQGPADLRNQRPYQLLFFAFSPESAVSLPKDDTHLSAQLDIGNDLLIPFPSKGATVVEDTETQRLAVKERRGLANGWEYSISVPVIARNGGFLDKIVETYHQLIGLTHPTQDVITGRHDIPLYQSKLLVVNNDGRTLVDAGSAFGIGDLSGTVKRTLYKSRWDSYALRGGVKLPTGNAGSLIGSGGADIGIDLDADVALTHRICLFTNLSHVWLQKDTQLGNLTAPDIYRYVFSVEYYANSRSSWLIQDDIGQAAIRTGNTFADNLQTTLSFVYKRKIGKHSAWTYAFTENGDIFQYRAAQLANIGPDVTVSAGWETDL
jgi:hypothetical protein